MIYQNHVIDPTYFYDAIEEFSFNFVLYVCTETGIDERGRTTATYSSQIVRGSLQSQGSKYNREKSGATVSHDYKFYCKSLYRINIGDVLEYKGNYYQVTGVQDYDEYGCRECDLTMIQLTNNRNLADYIKYLNGEELV